LRGTPAYLSPEQARREEVIDGRSDIYSLGIIAFEMLTGFQPFEGDSPLAVILKHVHDQPPSIRAVNPDFPPALDEVIQRSLAKDPQDRYPSGRSFIKELRKPLEAIQTEESSLEPNPPAAQAESRSRRDPDVETSHQGPASSAGLPGEFQSEPGLEISPGEEGENGRKKNLGWQAKHLIALGAASWTGLALAAFFVIAIRVVQARSTVNVRMTYDQAGVNLINVSEAPLDLNGVTFQRSSSDRTVQSVYSTTVWSQLPTQNAGLLPSGGCYQLLNPGTAALKLNPGKPLPRPEGCRVLSGWLVALDSHLQYC
jgi:serine/threonine protein kinase